VPQCEILYPTHEVQRTPPVNLHPGDMHLFAHEMQKTIPDAKLLTLKNVYATPDGTLFHNRRILPESFAVMEHFSKWRLAKRWSKYFVRTHLLQQSKTLENDAIWITNDWSTVHFHWMLDTLPRLWVLGNRMRGATLLFPGALEQNEDYIRASLQPFGYLDIRFVHQTTHCKKMLLPLPIAPTGNYNEKVVKELQALYRSHYPAATDVSDKIYVSRKKANKRRVVNEAEVSSFLEKYGFQTFCLEDYPFARQMQIVANARYLVSNHGAGLTNILLMATGGKTLELRQEGDASDNCYFALASALGLAYYYQICDSEYLGEDAHTANLVVNVEMLKNNVESMLAF
jgi:capsular polysaccharide biosynthesis protein